MKAAMMHEWQEPAEVPPLGGRGIHVWLLEIDETLRPTLEASLSEPELERAAAFRFPVHRNEFVIARGALRLLLGKYLHLAPAVIDIQCSERGKPYLVDRNIRFNLSHSGKYAVFGVRLERELGIDIERHQPDVIDAGLLDQCLATAEKQSYLEAREPQRVQFFFDTWARKEAYMKLKGEGLNIPPNEFSLSSPDTVSGTIRSEKIHFAPLPLIDGYSAAVATLDQPVSVEFYKLGSNLLK